jgi:hypothetical protein
MIFSDADEAGMRVPQPFDRDEGLVLARGMAYDVLLEVNFQ